MGNIRSINFDRFKQDVTTKSKLEISGHTNQIGGHLSYGYANIHIPSSLHYWKGVVYSRKEGEGTPHKLDTETFIPDVENWWDLLVALCVEVLSTGRTCEVGTGINLRSWQFSVHGRPTDYRWESLVEDMKGRHDVTWNLNPDYQRGSVWSPEQQE